MAQKTFNGTKINVEFSESSSRQQLNSGENISTLFGKIKKIFSDLKAVCFSGSYNDLNDKPSALPANGGNSLTVNGHTVNSDVPYNAVFTDTVYNDAHIISALEGKSGIGHTHSKADITDFPASLPANGGNADYATNAGNANNAGTVGGITDGYYLGTLDMNGGGNGAVHRLRCQYRKFGDDRFGLKIESGYEVRCDYASNADAVNGVQVVCANDANTANWLAAFTSTNNLRAIDPARAYVGNAGNANMVRSQCLIGTSSNCAYNTIQAWANAQTGTAYASIVAGDGFPADAPHQNEAMLKVESDYYGIRKIVTWTRYLGGQPRLVMIRPIFGTNWNDDQWRA